MNLRKKDLDNTPHIWWLRFACISNDNFVGYVNNSGYVYDGGVHYYGGIILACII